MINSLKKMSLGLLVLVAGCANVNEQFPNDEFPLPKEGDIVSEYVRVGIYDIPLPSGEWIVTEATGKASNTVPKGKVILAQREGKTLSNAVVIETPLSVHLKHFSVNSESDLLGTKYTSQGPLEVNNALYTETFYVSGPNLKVKGRGISYPSLMYIAPTKMEAKFYGKDFLKKTGMDFPTRVNFFRVGFQLSSFYNPLKVSYFLDPRVEKMLIVRGDVKESNLNPDRHYRLPEADKDFIEKLKAWAFGMKDLVLESFDSRQ